MEKHLVHRQKVTLHIPKRDDAFALQSMVSYLLQNDLKVSLESALDKAFSPGKVVRIDTLKLDLGEINPQNFEREFKTRFVEALAESLSAKSDSINNSSGDESILSVGQSSVNALIFFLEKGYLPWYSSVQKITEWEDCLLQDLTKTEYQFFAQWLKENQSSSIITRLILQFSDRLLTALLQNISPAMVNDNWELMFADYVLLLNVFDDDKLHPSTGKGQKSHKKKALTDSGDPSYDSEYTVFRNKIWQFAFEVLLNERYSEYSFQILNRLTEQFNIKSKPVSAVKEKQILASIKTSAVKGAFKKLVLFFKSNSDPISSKANTSINDDQTLIDDTEDSPDKDQDVTDSSRKESGKTKSKPTNDKVDAGDDLTANDQTSKNKNLRNNKDDITSNSLSNDLKSSADHVDNNNKIDAEDSLKQSDRKKNHDDQTTIAANELKAQSKADAAKKRNKSLSLDEKDIISINNCGTVILTPFIKMYFERTALMEDNKFIDDDARERAVMLLYYLATGATEAAEFDLALQKILCGHPLERPLATTIKLSAKEKRQSTDLLKNVLNYWEPLKSSSVGAFREAFMQRNGNLELRENGWLLKVEQKTIDILLGKLPWGFSTIRHPWMENILSVDWY